MQLWPLAEASPAYLASVGRRIIETHAAMDVGDRAGTCLSCRNRNAMNASPYVLEIIEVGNRLQNIIYLLHCTATNTTAAVDPTEAEPVLAALATRDWTLDFILTTHHHADHTDGNLPLKAATNCTVIGSKRDGARIPAIDIGLEEGETFTVGALHGTVIETSGHTLGHIAFYFESSKLLFSGDCLFSMGCGRIFEGTAAQAYASLQKLASLPDDTWLYPGHEYTLANGAFALSVETDNAALHQRLQQAKELRESGRPTMPVPMGTERTTNPFLRCDRPAIRQTLDMKEVEDVEVFTRLRAMKDRF